MSYPYYPNNRLIVNGVDLTERFKMVLLDGYTLAPPSPKTYTVDIPGGNGKLDLTESVYGDTTYDNRTQNFEFAVIDVDNFEKVKTEVSNFLHGRAFDYQLTMDPGYTYHGRFSVADYSHTRYANTKVGIIKVDIDAKPFKMKDEQVLSCNAIGGAMINLPSGRMRVRPVIETDGFARVIYDRKVLTLPQGTWILNDLLLTEGDNELYLNTYDIRNLTWDDICPENLLKVENYADTYPKTVGDMVFTRDEYGVVTANGSTTTSDNAYVTFTKWLNSAMGGYSLVLPPGEYYMCGCPKGGGANEYYLRIDGLDVNGANAKMFYDYGDGVSFTLNNTYNMRVMFSFKAGFAHTADHMVINPKLIDIYPDQEILTPFVSGTTATINGITFTTSEDGSSVTANGTFTDGATMAMFVFKYADTTNPIKLPIGKYRLSGSAYDEGSGNIFGINQTNSIGMECRNGASSGILNITEEYAYIGFNASWRILNNTDGTNRTVENLVCRPQIELLSDNPITWGELKNKRLYEWYKTNSDGNYVVRTWQSEADKTWADLATSKWSDMSQKTDITSQIEDVYIKYDWGDL